MDQARRECAQISRGVIEPFALNHLLQYRRNDCGPSVDALSPWYGREPELAVRTDTPMVMERDI